MNNKSWGVKVDVATPKCFFCGRGSVLQTSEEGFKKWQEHAVFFTILFRPQSPFPSRPNALK